MAFNELGQDVTVLYNGEVELCFDQGEHKYYVDGEEVPSVTTILGVINKPLLVGWAANQGAEYFRRHIEPGATLDEIDIEEIATGIRWAYRNKTRGAAAIGTVAHNYCEKAILHKLGKLSEPPKRPVNKAANQAVDAFVKWVKKNEIEFIGSEEKVYSREYRYSGTADVDCNMGGERCLVDFKTSSGIYAEYVLQVAAYRAARTEELGVHYDAAWVVRICKKTGRFTSKRFGSETLDEAFEAFVSFKVAGEKLRSVESVVKKGGRK